MECKFHGKPDIVLSLHIKIVNRCWCFFVFFCCDLCFAIQVIDPIGFLLCVLPSRHLMQLKWNTEMN